MPDDKLRVAVAKAKAKYTVAWWEPDHDPKEMAYYQLNEPILLVNFGDFHVALEKLLGRSIWSHEFAVCLTELREEARRTRMGKPYSAQEKAQAIELGMQRLQERLGGNVVTVENTPEDPEGNARLS